MTASTSPDRSSRDANGLDLDVNMVEKLAGMSREERAKATAQLFQQKYK